MSDETVNNTTTIDDSTSISDAVPRTASKKSVDKALEIIRARSKKKTVKRKQELEDEKDRLISNSCLMSYTTSLRRINVSSAFTNNFAAIELRNALRSEDWISIQQLFLILLKCFYIEPLAWKYAFLIYFLSPASDQFEFQEFFKMCIGVDLNNDSNLLEQLLSLQKKDVTNK